jgi:hypothetical protein
LLLLFMFARRISAALTAALLLRLNVVAVDGACAKHETEHASHEQQAAQVHDHGGHGGHEEAPSPPADSCEVPQQRDCCQALASCGLTLGDSDIERDVALAGGETQRSALGAQRPASLNYAPEPPPPKV